MRFNFKNAGVAAITVIVLGIIVTLMSQWFMFCGRITNFSNLGFMMAMAPFAILPIVAAGLVNIEHSEDK